MDNLFVRQIVQPVARAVGAASSSALISIGVTTGDANTIAGGIAAAVVVGFELFLRRKKS